MINHMIFFWRIGPGAHKFHIVAVHCFLDFIIRYKVPGSILYFYGSLAWRLGRYFGFVFIGVVIAWKQGFDFFRQFHGVGSGFKTITCFIGCRFLFPNTVEYNILSCYLGISFFITFKHPFFPIDVNGNGCWLCSRNFRIHIMAFCSR